MQYIFIASLTETAPFKNRLTSFLNICATAHSPKAPEILEDYAPPEKLRFVSLTTLKFVEQNHVQSTFEESKKKTGTKSTNITKSQLYTELRPLWKIVRAPILIQELSRPPNSNISKLLENTITVMTKPVVQHHAFSLFWLTACLSQILPSPSVFLRIGILHAS